MFLFSVKSRHLLKTVHLERKIIKESVEINVSHMYLLIILNKMLLFSFILRNKQFRYVERKASSQQQK